MEFHGHSYQDWKLGNCARWVSWWCFMVMKLSSHPIKLQPSLSLPCQQNWWYLISWNSSWNSHWDRPNSNKPTRNPRTAFILTLGVMLEITVEEFQWTNWKHTRSQDRSELPKKCRNIRGVGTSEGSELPSQGGNFQGVRTSYKFWAQQTTKTKSKFDQTISKLREIGTRASLESVVFAQKILTKRSSTQISQNCSRTLER